MPVSLKRCQLCLDQVSIDLKPRQICLDHVAMNLKFWPLFLDQMIIDIQLHLDTCWSKAPSTLFGSGVYLSKALHLLS